LDRSRGDRELVGGGYGEEIQKYTENMKDTTIIRLICIDKYNGFKYRRCLEIRRQSRNGYRSSGGGVIV